MTRYRDNITEQPYEYGDGALRTSTAGTEIRQINELSQSI